MLAPLVARAWSFVAREDGGISAISLQIFMASLVLGGLAIDFGNGQSAKTQLQVAADAAAHAAIYTRETSSPADAKKVALEIAALNMPSGKYGSVLAADDIKFGRWNRDADVFTFDPLSREAVLVSTERYKENGNGVATYLLGMVGMNAWDVASQSVFETYYPTCFREGFVAQDRVEIQSNSTYGAGFCIHSQSHVKVSSNNIFEHGVVVSMPDKTDAELPSSGYESNEGLAEALRDGSYKLRILNRIQDIYTGLVNPLDPKFGIMTRYNEIGDENEYYRGYIKNKLALNLNYKTDAGPGTFSTGRIHVVHCKKDKLTYDLRAGTVLKNAVLITDCRLTISAGATVEDAVIFSDNTESTAVRGPSGVKIGADDNCAAGGDVQIVTRGSVSFASAAEVYGSQIIAAGDIELTANTNGLEGVSLVAGGTLDVTSNGAYGFCGGSGMENNYEAAYFRLVR